MEISRKKVVELNIEDVLPNRFQPRIKFNEEAINELSNSIKEHGVIQPIVVRPIGDKYEIIAGERRYKASCIAGLKTIPAIITDLNDKDSAEVALIENVQRENLTPIEEAISYKKILDMGYITQDGLAAKLGKTQSTVANKLRLLNLDDEVQEALLKEKISERHARSLLKLTDKAQQKQMLNKIISERLTVRRADEEIEKILKGENIQSMDQREIPINMLDELPKDKENPSFKFINMQEEQKQPEPQMNKVEINEEEDLKPSQFFNILDKEESKQEETIPSKFFNTLDKEEPKQEEQKIDFNSIFMNPNPQIINTAPIYEELNDIENSIKNSNNLPPIFKNETIEQEKNNDEFDDDLEFIEEDDEFVEEENTSEPSDYQEEKEQQSEMLEKQNTIEKQIKIEQKENKINDFKDVLQVVRNCSDRIEESGFIIDTEEYDLEDIYQFIIRINKNK